MNVGYEFDADTSLERVGERRFRGEIPDRWGVVGGAPNGGYLMTVAVRAMRAADTPPDPLSATAHYVKACRPGPVTVEVEPVRSGSRHTTAMARVIQQDAERLRVLATFGDLTAAAGPSAVTGTPPDLPSRAECVTVPPDMEQASGAANGAAQSVPPIVERFDLHLTPRSAGWAVGDPSGEAHMDAWLRFADGRPADTLSLAVFADALPPTALNVVDRVQWVPTIELTVHARGRPAPGWLRAVATTRFLMDGYMEEDVEIWDDDDRLVAQGRQLALLLRES